MTSKHAHDSILSGKIFLRVFRKELPTVGRTLCMQLHIRDRIAKNDKSSPNPSFFIIISGCIQIYLHISNTFKFGGIHPAVCVFNYLVITAMVKGDGTNETNAVFFSTISNFETCLIQLMYIFYQLRLYCYYNCVMYLKGLLTCYLLCYWRIMLLKSQCRSNNGLCIKFS